VLERSAVPTLRPCGTGGGVCQRLDQRRGSAESAMRRFGNVRRKRKPPLLATGQSDGTGMVAQPNQQSKDVYGTKKWTGKDVLVGSHQSEDLGQSLAGAWGLVQHRDRAALREGWRDKGIHPIWAERPASRLQGWGLGVRLDS